MGIKKKAYQSLRKLKRAERKAEKRLSEALRGERKKPAGEYIHPWSTQVVGTPSIVSDLEKRHCCGCGSCYNSCPTKAISMIEDEEGFLYPSVHEETCTNCGLCVKRCPVLVEQPGNRVVENCYATIMDDDGIRERSSSGGLFSQLAAYAFAKDGYIVGAAYEKPDTVKHRIIHDPAELDSLRRSKYVQSDTGTTYMQTKELLKTGAFVLYSGCPCQIAGLYAYLGKDYENLLTVDLVCHGCPSPGLFRRYVAEQYGVEGVREVNFRDKSAYGWSTHMNVYFKDGTVHREPCNKDPYYRMFLPCLAMRPFCSICKFTKLPRVADISIGDWWGIDKFDPTLNDRKGTSLLLVNNDKGEAAIKAIESTMLRFEEYPLASARPRNYTIDKPFKAHPARKRFFELLKVQSFGKAVRSSLDYHYDVGIFGLWFGENYGSMLTYYGLNKVIESMGLSSVMIENPRGSKRGYSLEPHRFARRQGYYVTKLRRMADMHELNSVCDSFLLGSDQLWNPGLSKPYGFSYFLSFADSRHKRIAYGTSFGKDTHVIEQTYQNRSAVELGKFDAISVRDDFSKSLLANRYGGIDAVKVLDPALLCEARHYEELANQASPSNLVGGGTLEEFEDYIFAYILDPDENTLPLLGSISKQTGSSIVLAIDYAPKARQKRLDLLQDSDAYGVRILDVPSCEQWLSAIRNSKCSITDSFHGSIFSFVFAKRFVCFPNRKRGHKRFDDLLTMLELQDRACEFDVSNVQTICELLETPIDYCKSNALLSQQRQFSYSWLEEALLKPKQVSVDRAFGILETIEQPNR